MGGQARESWVARRNGAAQNPPYRWHEADQESVQRTGVPTQVILEEGPLFVTDDDSVTSNHLVRQLEDRVRDIERLVGRKTLSAEILREVLVRSGAKASPCRAIGAVG